MYEQQNNRPQEIVGGQIPQKNEDSAPVNPQVQQNGTIFPHTDVFFGNVSPFLFKPSEEEIEKKEIRKKAYMISGSFLILDILTTVIGFILVFALTVLGFSTEQQTELLSNPAFQQLYQILVSITVFLLPFIIIYKFFRYRISDIASFKRAKKGTALPLFLIGIAACTLSNLLTNQASAIFEKSGVEYSVDFGDSPQGFFGVMLSVLATVVTAALVEEFVCRGLVMGLLRKHGDGFALVVSSLMFGLMHQNFIQIPFATLLGFALGYVTIKTGTLWIAIAIHAFNNGISVLFDYLPVSVKMSNFIYYILMIVVLFAGMVGIYMLKDNTEIFTLEKGKTRNTVKIKQTAFWLCPTVIIFTLFCLLSSLQFFV